MSYAAATAAYRDLEVLSAPPGRLVVIVYDHLLVHLRRSIIALDAGNLELLGVSLGKCQEAVGELMGNLDLEKGGSIARELSSLYAFFLTSLMDVSRKRDRKLLVRVTAQVTELRDAFAQIAAVPAASAA